jgi:cysteinyl-tRNA synthetase
MNARSLIILLLMALGARQSGVAGDAPRRFDPKSMAYILQPDSFDKVRSKAVQRLAECGRDLIVLDAFFGEGSAWTPAELETIRKGKSARRVVAYLSIGEAEEYREYWHKNWTSLGKVTTNAPAFLCAQDPEWKGNYKVKYWDPAWQKIILEQLDQIVAQGFDGAYLDIVDGFEFFEEDHGKYLDHRKNPDTGNEYRRDMIDWVKRIGTHSRQSKPDFLIIPQNGSQLIEQTDFIEAIDAIGIEDLFANGNKRQPKSHTKEILSDLAKLTPNAKPVLLIEYPQATDIKELVTSRARENQFVLLITDRPLKTLGTAVAAKP